MFRKRTVQCFIIVIIVFYGGIYLYFGEEHRPKDYPCQIQNCDDSAAVKQAAVNEEDINVFLIICVKLGDANFVSKSHLFVVFIYNDASLAIGRSDRETTLTGYHTSKDSLPSHY